MNERIRELAEQSGIEFDDDFSLEPETIYYLKLSDFEKFGELIIQECCIEIAEEAAKHSHYGMGVLAVSSNSIARIKQHFGIK